MSHPGDDDLVRDWLLKWDEIRRRGEPVSITRLCADRPELAEELEHRIQTLLAVEELVKSRTTQVKEDSQPLLDAAARHSFPSKLTATAVYRPRKRHAGGGQGEILVAEQADLGRTIALKRMLPHLQSDQARRRFLREAAITARLQHPGIVPIYILGHDESGPFYIMPFIRGHTLRQAIDEFHKTRATQARKRKHRHDLGFRGLLRKFIAACDTIHYAHDQGVVHRDLKPSNIMIGAYGETLVVDWGLAREFRAKEEDSTRETISSVSSRSTDPLTKAGAVIGTLAYMSPEQARGETTGPAGDIYCLGLILYLILTGKPAFDCTRHDEQELIRLVADGLFARPSEIDPGLASGLEAICLKALEFVPEARYPTPRALVDDLERWLAGEPIGIRKPTPWRLVRRLARRHPVALTTFALGFLFLAAATLGGYWISNRLELDRKIAQQLQVDLHDRTLTARRAQYVADLRQIPVLLDAYRTRNAHELLVRHRPGPGEQDLREFTWYHLWNRCHTARSTLEGHEGDVYYVEFSPRGDLIVSAGKDGMVRLWSASRGRLIRAIKASPTEVNVAAFSPDGTTLATVDDDGKLKLWDLATGECQLEQFAHEGDAVIARFTPDGRRLVTGGRKDGLIKIWDRATGKMSREFRGSDSDLENAVFSPDGATLACVGLGSITLRRFEDASLIAMLPTGGAVQGVAFSHDGTKLATANEHDWLVELWDVARGRRLRAFQGHEDSVFSVMFSSDDRTLFSAGDDLTIRRWDVETGTESGVFLGHTARIWNLGLSPDGRTLASASQDGAVMLWDAVPRSEPALLPIARLASFAFAPDGQSLTAFEPGNPSSLTRWDVRSGSMLERKPLELSETGASWVVSRDARLLAVADKDGSIEVWDLTTGQARGSLDLEPSREPAAFEFSHDSRFLEVVSMSRKGVWDLKSGRFIQIPRSEWNPDGFAASGELICDFSRDMLGAWDPVTGRTRIGPLKARGVFARVVISLDGRHVITSESSGRSIGIWSAEGLELERRIVGLQGGVGPMALSPDGKTLATVGVYDTVKLWDVAACEELVSFRGFQGPISMMAFSPDGKALATRSAGRAGKPSEFKLWRAVENLAKGDAIQGAETTGLP